MIVVPCPICPTGHCVDDDECILIGGIREMHANPRWAKLSAALVKQISSATLEDIHRWRLAQGIEARKGRDPSSGLDAERESPVAEGDAP